MACAMLHHQLRQQLVLEPVEMLLRAEEERFVGRDFVEEAVQFTRTGCRGEIPIINIKVRMLPGFETMLTEGTLVGLGLVAFLIDIAGAVRTGIGTGAASDAALFIDLHCPVKGIFPVCQRMRLP